ncbi:MAG: diadenylate cyclase CdaA [Pseudanabaenaceae cyanobacterium bins.68]|nr:diadenylate cyclase CdaA [Pseudanabaenaceae cyanobacterium bins.68]
MPVLLVPQILLLLDLLLVGLLIYLTLSISSDRRTLLMVRGFLLLLIIHLLSQRVLRLVLLSFILDKLVTGTAVAMAVMLQPEIRRFLEQMGRGNLWQLLSPIQTRRDATKPDQLVETLVHAVKELSQNRIGALIMFETGEPITDTIFQRPGIKINGELSSELLQTIFQTNTPLHDGAVLVRQERIIAAAIILPLSTKLNARRQIGTRHLAAVGITELIDHCFCVVVSEQTGSIAIAEHGTLERPITSAKLQEYLNSKLPRPTTLVRNMSFFSRLRGKLLAQSIKKP